MSVQRIRVPLGFAFAALYLYLCQPTPGWLLSGLGLATAGLALRIWATGYLEKWKGLAVSGPYRWTRNPLYLGSLLMGLGFTLAAAQPVLLVFFLLLFTAIYVPVMRREEQELIQGYGARFEAYRASVPLFFPFPARRLKGLSRRSMDPADFQWRRVISNREYNAILGFVALTAFICAKMLWK